jgi:hypothetical protein
MICFVATRKSTISGRVAINERHEQRARMRFVDRDVRSIEEDVMGLKVIGVDPHERSHTAVALDDD